MPRPAPRTFAEVPSATNESHALSRTLKRRGFRFVGPTTVHAVMQACGLVNDHLAGCPVREEVEALRASASLSFRHQAGQPAASHDSES
jgi:DNA-3-methyladenine glycosylase I